MRKIIAFDCDSTLSSIEGIDELARLAGPEVCLQVEKLTNQAMDGEVPLDEVFQRRLALISPSREQVAQVAQLYLDTVEPTAKATLSSLREKGWDLMILSGGFRECILPLAQELGIDLVEAVPLNFDNDGHYLSFDASYPTTYNGGKPEILAGIRSKNNPELMIMVGDGISDLETISVADHFVAYTGYINRPKVSSGTPHRIQRLSELENLSFV